MKLFVSDLDGTLLNSEHQLSEKSKEALRLLIDNGYEIALCSGRALSSVEYIAKEAGINAYAIGNNGSIISYKGDIIYKKPINKDTLQELISYALANDIRFHMYDHNTFYSNVYDTKRLKHLMDENGNVAHVKTKIDDNIGKYIRENNISIFKIMYYTNFGENVEALKAIKKHKDIYPSMSGTISADMVNVEVDKWTGIEFVKDHFGKSYDKVICIGDYENDIPMITNSDFGIAMGNALDTVKSKADYVTDTNDNEGFYKAVIYLLEGEMK
ncbi:MAG: HAD family hydrolase [Tissierellia bacterium]|nr:HAD family hydrolase [Tissierellia bacterium]